MLVSLLAIMPIGFGATAANDDPTPVYTYEVVNAYPHDQEGSFWERSVETSNGMKPMADIMMWPHFANLTGCPSTVVPAGQTREGLPVGFQIMGPYLEDSTCLDIAHKLADVTGGFVAPPGYE